MPDLRKALLEEWSKIPKETLQNLVESVLRRVKALIAAKGEQLCVNGLCTYIECDVFKVPIADTNRDFNDIAFYIHRPLTQSYSQFGAMVRCPYFCPHIKFFKNLKWQKDRKYSLCMCVYVCVCVCMCVYIYIYIIYYI